MVELEKKQFILGFLLGIFIVIVVLAVVDPDAVWHKKIVKAGHGEYNKTTGEFQFLPACNGKEK